MEKKTFTNISEIPTGIWKLERYGTYEAGKWTEIRAEKSNIYLILQNFCLALIHGQTLVEHVSLLTENIRMVKKHDSLGVIVTKENIKTKKIRMKFSGTGLYSGVMMVQHCTNILNQFVSVEDLLSTQASKYNGFSSQTPIFPLDRKSVKREEFKSVTSTLEGSTGTLEWTSLSQRVRDILKSNITEFYMDNKDLSTVYPLEDIVEACILDPDFPSFVAQVHEILINKLK